MKVQDEMYILRIWIQIADRLHYPRDEGQWISGLCTHIYMLALCLRVWMIFKVRRLALIVVKQLLPASACVQPNKTDKKVPPSFLICSEEEVVKTLKFAGSAKGKNGGELQDNLLQQSLEERRA